MQLLECRRMGQYPIVAVLSARKSSLENSVVFVGRCLESCFAEVCRHFQEYGAADIKTWLFKVSFEMLVLDITGVNTCDAYSPGFLEL